MRQTAIGQERVRLREAQKRFIDLVDAPLLAVDDDANAYFRVRRSFTALQKWFAEKAGWTISRRANFLRLIKVPSRSLVGFGFDWVKDPLDYEMFTWVLWYARHVKNDLFLVSELATALEETIPVAEGEARFDWADRSQAWSLYRAMQALEAMGAVRYLDGERGDFARGGEGRTFYRFTDLARRLHIALPPEIFEVAQQGGDLTQLLEHWFEVDAATPEQRLYRGLLLAPAFYRADDPEAFALLDSEDRRRAVRRDFRDNFLWDLEVTPSYAALLRPAVSTVAETFDANSGISHVALLFCGRVRDLVAEGALAADRFDRVSITGARFRAELAGLRADYAEHWGKGLGAESVARLQEDVARYMKAWNLLRGPAEDGTYHVMPLAARMRAVYATEETA